VGSISGEKSCQGRKVSVSLCEWLCYFTQNLQSRRKMSRRVKREAEAAQVDASVSSTKSGSEEPDTGTVLDNIAVTR
jgi:hypothetical protein